MRHRLAVLVIFAGAAITTQAGRAHASVFTLSNVVAYTGNQIPDQAAGITYGAIPNTPSISNDGHVVFGCAINGVAAANNQGIFSGTSGASVLTVAQSGTQAPGGPAGATMDLNGASSGFQNATAKISGGGLISFVSLMTGGGTVSTTNNWGVFTGTTGGSFSMLARSGTQVPGAAAGTIPGKTFPTPRAGPPR